MGGVFRGHTSYIFIIIKYMNMLNTSRKLLFLDQLHRRSHYHQPCQTKSPLRCLARLCTSKSVGLLFPGEGILIHCGYEGPSVTAHPNREPLAHVSSSTRPRRARRLPARVLAPDLGSGGHARPGHGHRTRAEDRHRGPEADGAARRAELQRLSSGLQPRRPVAPPAGSTAAPGRDRRLRPRGRRPELRHRRDPGTPTGRKDPHPRPLSRPTRLQQGAVGRGQRHPLDRPGPGRRCPPGHPGLGPAGPQPARSDARGQPRVGPTPQDHRRAGPADHRLPATLAARGRAERRRRLGLQRRRVGAVPPTPRRPPGRPAVARRPALHAGPAEGARQARPAPCRRRPPAQPRSGPGRPQDGVVPGRGPLVRRGRSRAGTGQRDGGLVPQRVRAAADPPGAGARPGRSAGAEGLLFDASRRRAGGDPRRGGRALADRGGLRGGPGPPRGRDAEAVVGPGDRAGDAVPAAAVLAGGVDRAGPPPEVADRDPGGVVVPEGGGGFLGRVGGGPSGMLGISGYSDIPR